MPLKVLLLLLTVNVMSLASDSLLVDEKDESDQVLLCRNEPGKWFSFINLNITKQEYQKELTYRTNRSSSFTVSRGGQKHRQNHSQTGGHFIVDSACQRRRETSGINCRN